MNRTPAYDSIIAQHLRFLATGGDPLTTLSEGDLE